MVLPKPVYEFIPTLYVVTGITAMSAVDSFMSFISGILMGGSGIAICACVATIEPKMKS